MAEHMSPFWLQSLQVLHRLLGQLVDVHDDESQLRFKMLLKV